MCRWMEIPLHPPLPLSRSSLFCCHWQKQRQQQRIWLNWLASAAKALRAQFAYIRFVIIIVDHRFKWGNAAAAARTEAGRNCESEYRTVCVWGKNCDDLQGALASCRMWQIEWRTFINKRSATSNSKNNSSSRTSSSNNSYHPSNNSSPRHGLMSSLWSFSLAVVALWPPPV